MKREIIQFESIDAEDFKDEIIKEFCLPLKI
jgi:hypothetical protein